MATYTLNPQNLAKDTAVLVAGGQATVANDIVDVKATSTVPLKGRYLALHITGGGATATITVSKGTQGQTPANLAHGGSDLVFTVGAAETKWVQLEMAKYLQWDATNGLSYVRLTVTGASATPTVRAVQLTKAA